MKKVIFGSACMVSGMLLGILLNLADVTPQHHDFGDFMAIVAFLFVAGGFLLAIKGLREDK